MSSGGVWTSPRTCASSVHALVSEKKLKWSKTVEHWWSSHMSVAQKSWRTWTSWLVTISNVLMVKPITIGSQLTQTLLSLPSSNRHASPMARVWAWTSCTNSSKNMFQEAWEWTFQKLTLSLPLERPDTTMSKPSENWLSYFVILWTSPSKRNTQLATHHSWMVDFQSQRNLSEKLIQIIVWVLIRICPYIF